MRNKILNLSISFLFFFMCSNAYATSVLSGLLGDAYNGSWAEIVDYDLLKTKSHLHLTITVGGDIPTDGSSGSIGYIVFTGINRDGNIENALFLTSHKCSADSLQQGPADGECEVTVGLLNALFGLINEEHNDATWHVHFLDLKAVNNESVCWLQNSIGLEVDLARTLDTNNNLSPAYPVKVNNPEDEVDNPGKPYISVSDIHKQDFYKISSKKSIAKKAIVLSVGLTAFADDQGTVTNLCFTTPPGAVTEEAAQ